MTQPTDAERIARTEAAFYQIIKDLQAEVDRAANPSSGESVPAADDVARMQQEADNLISFMFERGISMRFLMNVKAIERKGQELHEKYGPENEYANSLR